MKPENILKSDYLDILFENKNKAYGAYDLRKTYPNRLIKSLGTMLGCILVFTAFQSWKTPKKTSIATFDTVVDITLKSHKDKIAEKEKPKALPKPKAQQPMAEAAHNVPRIVKENVETTLQPNEVLDSVAITNKTNLNAPASNNIIGIQPGPTVTTGTGSINTNDSLGVDVDNEVDDSPIYNPSQQPEYPGGINALRHFMLRNLRQPDDIEEGNKVVVLAKFVVNKNGGIEQIEVVESGREDLDQEVKRVINKMPHWKPGMQAGKAVNVYFRIPVTFTSAY